METKTESKHLISVRQTQKGDWLIFEAIPYREGIGVDRVGEVGQGYTTGTQYGRADTEEEALGAANALAAEKSNQWTTWEVIEWEPVKEKNQQFCNLPKKYPTQTDYESKEAAQEDGWVYINPAKTLAWHRGRVIYVRDDSGTNRFGYSLIISIKEERTMYGSTPDHAIFAHSREVWFKNESGQSRLSIRFRSGDVVDAIEAAKRWIDDDLITIKEAAALLDTSVQNASQMATRGALTAYENSSASGSRQGARLVSKAQVLRRMGVEND